MSKSSFSVDPSHGTIARSLQTVFRVSSEKKKVPYGTRRAHKKSRQGCFTCKKRRVKCDEERPSCQKCIKRNEECIYISEVDRSPRVRSPNLTAAFFSLSLDDIATNIEQTLSLATNWEYDILGSMSPSGPSSLVAFRQFVTGSTDIMANPAIQHVMRTDMIHVAFQSPYLMNTILAVGSLHLNRLSHSKERSFAESYFWHNAIQLYQQALSMDVRKDNVDALLSTCMLMGVMTLCPEGFKPIDSWVLTNKPDAMNWLCLQSGLRCILKMAAPFIAESIWATAFSEVDKEERQIFDEVQQGREGLDQDLADLCEIDEFTSEANSVYYAPLRILSPLLQLVRSGQTAGSNAAHCASFMGRLEFDFLALLKNRDPPALILLAHWMGIMCLLSEDQPWVEGRIRAECIAICMFMEPSTDPQIRRLLYFPATSCGYELDVLYA